MGTFVIFWSVIIAIVFFITGILFKALASFFCALISSLGKIIVIGGLMGVVALGLYLLYDIACEGLGQIFLLIVYGLIIAAIFGLMAPILEIASTIFGGLLLIVSAVLDAVAEWCEGMYEKNLKVIISRLDLH